MFHSLAGSTIRRFFVDTFAGDEQSRLWVKMAKVNGQWLIATSLSRKTGNRHLPAIENIPPQFPSNSKGNVDFN
jgi:hypothetical protein